MSVLVPVTMVTETTAKEQHQMYKRNKINDTTQTGKKRVRKGCFEFAKARSQGGVLSYSHRIHIRLSSTAM